MATELHACVVCGGALEPAFEKDGVELVSCSACHLLMRRLLPDRSELEQIYAHEYFELDPQNPVDGYADYLGDAEGHREAARRRLALLRRFVSPGKLLDVGAAAGFFVDEAQSAGWAAEGVDVAAQMVEWGVRELGVPLRVGELATVSGSDFRAVTMWDYLEHSLDPAGDLEQSRELLQPGGIVALSTGDRNSLVARLTRSRWHLLTPRHHNFFFSAATVSRLLERTGFTVEWIAHPGGRYSLVHLAYKGLPPAVARRLATSRVAGVRVPVNLFDIVKVVARKRR